MLFPLVLVLDNHVVDDAIPPSFAAVRDRD